MHNIEYENVGYWINCGIVPDRSEADYNRVGL